MKQTLLILAMSSIVAYGQDTTKHWHKNALIKGCAEFMKTAKLSGDTITEAEYKAMGRYKVPITFGEHKQPKYKDLTLRASNGMAIERIMWGADSTLSIRLIDSNEKQTTMKYKLIETK